MKTVIGALTTVARTWRAPRLVTALVCAVVSTSGALWPASARAEQAFIDAVPTVVSPTSALVTRRQAWLGGDVVADNGDAVTERGVVYSLQSVNANPEIIVVTTRGLASVGGIDGLLDLPGIAQTPAAKTRSVVSIDDDLLFSFGPRTGELIIRLAQAFKILTTEK